jgi:hypothetical protein
MRRVANRTIVVLPSRRLRYLVHAAHVAAICSIFLAALPRAVHWVLLLVVLASWGSLMPAVLKGLPAKIKRLLGVVFHAGLEPGAVTLVLGGHGQLEKVAADMQNVGSGGTVPGISLLSLPAGSPDLALSGYGVTAVMAARDGNVGSAETLTLQPQTVVLPFLVVLLYRQASRRRVQALLVLSDSLSAEDFRYLRVWVRWQVKWHTGTED